MFRRILVPLDGSDRAEQALPVAARLARASGGSLVLLQVITSPVDFAKFSESLQAMQDAVESNIFTAKQYLAAVAASKELAGIKITTEVLPGDPALTIFPAIRLHQADFIVMCSHGVTGYHRWPLGSVALKVARHSPLPVLILREGASIPANLHPTGVRSVRILVTLDGSVLAERALVPAAHLSAALSAPAPGVLHLLRVLHLSTEKEENQYDAEAKKHAISDAEAYLQVQEQRLRESRAEKLVITSSVVCGTDVADRIIGIAESGESMDGLGHFEGCDLIAMATHGRGGVQRWVMGSVTERVLGATRLPLLIVRSEE